jgi:hypothetical protein
MDPTSLNYLQYRGPGLPYDVDSTSFKYYQHLDYYQYRRMDSTGFNYHHFSVDHDNHAMGPIDLEYYRRMDPTDLHASHDNMGSTSRSSSNSGKLSS